MVLYKLVVLGDGGVGKTALTIQLCLQHFVETVRSSGRVVVFVAAHQDRLSPSPPPSLPACSVLTMPPEISTTRPLRTRTGSRP